MDTIQVMKAIEKGEIAEVDSTAVQREMINVDSGELFSVKLVDNVMKKTKSFIKAIDIRSI